MPGAPLAAVRPRERILAAARELFHRHGIRGVGVDTIADAAGTNKMTLYRHFQSKDDLILAYVRAVAAEGEAMWQEIARDHPGDSQAQLDDWLMRAAKCVSVDGRGCDLANAAVELTEDDHPARRLIEELKTDHRDRLASLCHAAGVVQSEALADTLTLLLEGARVSRLAAGRKGPSAEFIRTAQTVIQSFKTKPKAKHKDARPRHA
ncbi:TetR/AcrR family transcriptional regulator [Bradyrhizobium canariense]|uniref:Transcriptional regulator, TetR family n=1 Tax=Bradyrhizobium canariense TaxID=255045 RepID=A0A1H1XWS2_9BRAD|nr:TetR/AcrR family transcriptional regulator [Bradyrhizobium canariense]SDT13319.1 transcriptional regulator, TetR family [Bradyrhizobium canariense]